MLKKRFIPYGIVWNTVRKASCREKEGRREKEREIKYDELGLCVLSELKEIAAMRDNVISI